MQNAKKGDKCPMARPGPGLDYNINKKGVQGFLKFGFSFGKLLCVFI